MNQRRRVQELHERFNVNVFLRAFNARYQADFTVIDEPNPPEAIIRSRHSTRWVEVTTAYLSEAYAIDLNTYAVQGEKHIPSEQSPVANQDEQFAAQFVRVVTKKLEKSTYEPFFSAYGKGYLVVSIKDPFFGRSTLSAIDQAWKVSQVLDKGFFRSVYIVYPVFGKYKVALWKAFK